MFKVPNQYRDRHSPSYRSDERNGNNGRFIIPHPRILNQYILIMASDGEGWEHVSVSTGQKGRSQTRCPTWEEMCYVKSIFWEEDDCVIQYHPTKSEYVNMHPYVLHLWRPTYYTIPIPPKEMVGVNPDPNERHIIPRNDFRFRNP